MNSTCIFVGIFVLTIFFESCVPHGSEDIQVKNNMDKILEAAKELQRLDQAIKFLQGLSPLSFRKLNELANWIHRRKTVEQHVESLAKCVLSESAQFVTRALKVPAEERNNFVQSVLHLLERLIYLQTTSTPKTTSTTAILSSDAKATTSSSTMTATSSTKATPLSSAITSTSSTKATTFSSGMSATSSTKATTTFKPTTSVAATTTTTAITSTTTVPTSATVTTLPEGNTTANVATTSSVGTTKNISSTSTDATVYTTSSAAATTTTPPTAANVDFGSGIND